MPLLITDGTTARQQRTGVVWAEGKVTSDVAYKDMRFDTARSAGYGFFKLDLTGIEIDGKQLVLQGLSAANTAVSSGYFGGFYAHGESSNFPHLGSTTSNRMHSQSFFRISADRTGDNAGRYFGNFTIYITHAVDSSQTNVNAARINGYWQGTMRVSSVYAASIAGGGVCTGSCDYGIRIGTDDGSSNWGLGSYCLTAFKEGGQF